MDNLLKVVKNRYEAVIVASREARRLNNLQRLSGSDQKSKVTVSALQRLVKGEIKWEYGTVEDLKLDKKPEKGLELKIDQPMEEEPEESEEEAEE